MTAPYLTLALACAAGIGLGLCYFGGLWLTVRRLPSARSPMPIALASFVARTAVATSSRLGTLPPFTAASMPFSAIVAASYASAAYGSGFLPNFFLNSSTNAFALGSSEAGPAAAGSPAAVPVPAGRTAAARPPRGSSG